MVKFVIQECRGAWPAHRFLRRNVTREAVGRAGSSLHPSNNNSKQHLGGL